MSKPRQVRGVPKASSAEAKKRMESTRRRDTAAEIAIRSLLFRLGFRYRVDASPLKDLPRRADLLFPAAKVAVYIDGCFWHGCPYHATWPKKNAEFWRNKIESNRARDADTNRRLRKAGWAVVRVWEHEDPTKATNRIRNKVLARKPARSP